MINPTSCEKCSKDVETFLVNIGQEKCESCLIREKSRSGWKIRLIGAFIFGSISALGGLLIFEISLSIASFCFFFATLFHAVEDIYTIISQRGAHFQIATNSSSLNDQNISSALEYTIEFLDEHRPQEDSSKLAFTKPPNYKAFSNLLNERLESAMPFFSGKPE